MLRVPPCRYFRHCCHTLRTTVLLGGETAKQEGAAEELGGKVEGCTGEEAVFPRQERRNAMTPSPPPEHPITSTTNALGWPLCTILLLLSFPELCGAGLYCVSRHEVGRDEHTPTLPVSRGGFDDCTIAVCWTLSLHRTHASYY